jgi:hypothetical protein
MNETGGGHEVYTKPTDMIWIRLKYVLYSYIVLCLFHLVCIMCCVCFNLLCNMCVCVCVGFVVCGCFVNVFTVFVLFVPCYLYSLVYVYLLFVLSVLV